MIIFWRCAFDYLRFEGYSWLICDLIWQDISNDRTGICREKERQKLAFLNGFSPAKGANVMGRDGAETRGLSSEGRGKKERQLSCSLQAPLWPPWTTLDENVCIYVPPPSLSYSTFLFPDKGPLLTSPYLCLKPPLWKRHEENERGCNNKEEKSVFNIHEAEGLKFSVQTPVVTSTSRSPWSASV